MRRQHGWALGVGVVVGIVAVPLGIGAMPSRTNAAAAVITTNLSGPQLFQLACASCHGIAAYGRVLTMDGQTIRTPNIRYAALAKMYTKNFDAQARRAIVEGIDEQGKPLNPMMPRWTNLSSADVAKIIAHLKTLK